jgi:GxxExxY protein
MEKILFKDESYKIIGACFEVYNHKGFGFTEPVYQECLQQEFLMQDIPFVAQPGIPMSYKGRRLNQRFVPDFICFGAIILEIKAVAGITDAHRAQTLNYLHATEYELGILVNFGQFPKLAYERLACNRRNAAARTVYEVRGASIDQNDF